MFPKLCSSFLVISLLLPSFAIGKTVVKTKAKTTSQKLNTKDPSYFKKLSDLTTIVENKNLYFSADTETCFKPGGSFLNSSLVFKNPNEDCKEKNSRSRMQSSFFSIMNNYQCTKNELDNQLLSKEEKINLCKTNSSQLSTLFNKFNSYDSNKDDFTTSSKMKCTILILAGAKKHMALDSSLKSVLNNITDEDSADGKLSALNNLVGKLYAKDKAKIRSCNFNLADETKCVSGLQNDTIRAVVSKLTLQAKPKESLRYQGISQTIGIEALRQNRRSSQSQGNLKDVANNGKADIKPNNTNDLEETYVVQRDKDDFYAGLTAGLNKVPGVSTVQQAIQIPMQQFAGSERKPASLNADNQSNDENDKLFDVFRPFGFDMDKIVKEFNQRIASKSKAEEKRILSELIVELSNKAYDQECSKSVLYNSEKLCKKINEEIESTNNESNDRLMRNISDYVKENKKSDSQSMYKDISSEAIANLADNPANFKMNYANFLNKLNFMENCISQFGDNSFGKIEEKTQYESFNKVITEFVKGQNEKEADRAEEIADNFFKKHSTTSSRILAASLAETKSEDAKVEFLNSLRRDTISQINGGVAAQNLNEAIQNKGIAGQNNSVLNNSALSDTALLDKGMLNSLGSSIKTNGQLNNATTTNSSYLSSQPIIGSNNTYVDRQNSFSESNSLQKKLEELTAKENSLKDKMNSEGSSTSSNKEMDSLQKQIEELRNQLADSKKDTAKAINQATIAKESSSKDLPTVTTNNVPTYDFKKATYGNSNSKREDRNLESNNGDSARFESGSIGSASSGASSQAVASRSISSVGGRSADSVKGFGLVLTKSGEATEDISKIADNPKDADILVLAEKSNGKPFIIRENGDLIQVQIKLDANGKPVYINGKPELLKKKLSKDAQIQVAKNLDAIREAKEVRDTVRLQQLNQLMLESK